MPFLLTGNICNFPMSLYTGSDGTRTEGDEIVWRLTCVSFRYLTIYITFSFLVAGCSVGYTEVRLSGVTRYKVNQTLWNTGGYDELVWPSIKKANDQKVVVKYDDTVSAGWFSYSVELLDTIKIVSEEDNNIIVSLQCKESQFLQWAMYRNKIKEHQILWKMAQALRKKENISVEWIGDWKPRNEPVIISDENTKWIAYHNDTLLMKTDFMDYWHPEYIKSDVSTQDRIIFRRWIDKEPINVLFFGEPGQESYEKIIIKRVPHEDKSYEGNSAIVIGVAAKGTEYKKMLLSSREEHTDIGEKLRNMMINRIVDKVFWGTGDTLFLDPSPWIEEIELPDLVKRSK